MKITKNRRKTPSDGRDNKSSWIRLIRKDGDCAVGRFIILRYEKRSTARPVVAYIVSKKIGKAVVRNRIRRRLRELFRTRISSRLEPGRYVMLAKRNIGQATFQQLEKDMVDLAERIS